MSTLTLPAAAEDSPGYRQPPHNLEAEQALLGAMLVNNEAAQQVQGLIEPEHFFEPVHGRIFEAIIKLIDRNQVADPIKLAPFFEQDETLAPVGGAQYLVRLASAAATILNARDYAQAIYDLAVRRQLIGIGQDVVLTAYDAPIDEPALDQVEAAEQRLFDLADKGRSDSRAVTFASAMARAIENIEKAYKDPDKLSGITTGLAGLNNKLGGLHPSDLIILAGRPAMGKTALATNIAFNAALRRADDEERGEDVSRSKGAAVAFSRWKCRLISWPRGSSRTAPASRRRRCAGAASTSSSSTRLPARPWRWSGSSCSSTTPRP